MDLNGIPPPYSMQDLFLATPEEHPPAYRRLPLYEDIVRDVGQLGEAMGVAESPMAQNNDIGSAVFAAEIDIFNLYELFLSCAATHRHLNPSFAPTQAPPQTEPSFKLFADDKEVKVGVEFAGKEARELLRGSLPVPSLPEYSFEGSAPLSSLSVSQATASIESSVGSLPLSSLTHSIDPGPRPPGVSVTIHVKHEQARSPRVQKRVPVLDLGHHPDHAQPPPHAHPCAANYPRRRRWRRSTFAFLRSSGGLQPRNPRTVPSRSSESYHAAFGLSKIICRRFHLIHQVQRVLSLE
ncbi:hypothetical protein B0H14DRAFT_2654188 [Mycena olivaceomarginata]|nr:hypothetical protein B0H14DRAFT_2654188 [Mycena olivaceomarginata]